MKIFKSLCLVIITMLFINCKSKIESKKPIETNMKLLGAWVYTNPSLNDSKYQFFKDSTWKFSITMDNGKESITKGKYLIGDENEVFLRCFGSQHWPSNGDTIHDIRTS